MEKKKVSIYEILKWILSVFIVIAFAVLGSLCHNTGNYSVALCVAAIIVLPITLIVGTVLGLVFKKKLINNLDRENLQNDLLAQRERAAEIAKEKLNTLHKLIKIIDLMSVVVLVMVCVIVFCFFTLVGAEGGGVALPMVLGVYAGLFFVRPRKIKINEKKSEDYLKESDYPLLYETARRAANTIGCEGRIKIFVDHDFNAGILTIADGYSVRLGSYLLDNMSQDELYNVLLHEFAHVDKKNDEINDVISYANLSQENDTTTLGVAPYIYFHAKFILEFVTYQYVCSLMNEDAADSAMREHGNPEIAASMLIKLKFSELYQWERSTYDEEILFESESLIEDCIRRPLRWFKERMELRQDAWIRMIDSEILSRNATHSTVKMRIESLGVKEARLMPGCDSEEYLAEVDKAILHMEQMVRKGVGPNYAQIREQNYLAPKKVIDEWKKEGKPITREGYQGVVVALFSLYRITEFANLCCQIIEEIPEPANYFAHHMYGMYLLHSYDERGIEHLYKSIELNHNNWEEAMQTIGEYACIVGKQDELDKYRERAKEMLKTHIDVYEKMDSLTSKDKLVEERLPDGMLEDFLDYVKGIDDGAVEKIYMVRKVIDEKHFVTCVVVQPKKKVKPEKFGEVMDKIFQYLDKSSDWQFSLFDIRFIAGVRVDRVKNSLVYDTRAKK